VAVQNIDCWLRAYGFEPGVKRNFWLRSMYACTK